MKITCAMRSVLPLAMACAVSVACSRSHDSVSGYEIVDLASSEMQLGGEEIMLGNPIQLTRVGDNLIITDAKADSFVHYVDLAAKVYVGQFLPKGQGPGDYRSPVLLAEIPGDSKHFMLSEPNGHRFMRMEAVAGNPSSIRCVSTMQLPDDAWIVMPIADGRMVTTNGYVQHYELLTLLNPDGSVDRHYGRRPAPASAFDQPPMAMTAAFQFDLKVSPDGKRIAAIGSMGESGAFFHLDGDSIVTVREFCNEAALPNNHFENGDYYGVDGESVTGFIYSAANADGVYVLTSERKLSDPDSYSGDRILIYDWDGNPVGEYHLDRRIRLFTAPDATGTVYAVTEDGCDPTLIGFHLPD